MNVPTPRRPGAASLVGAALLACGCGTAPEPLRAPVALTAAYEPSFEGLPLVLESDGTHELVLVERGGRPWLEVRYRAAAWNPLPVEGCFAAHGHLARLLVTGELASAQELVVDGRVGRHLADPPEVLDAAALAPGSFVVVGGVLGISTGVGGAPPELVVHRAPLPVGEPLADSWHLRTGAWSGEGFLVPAGAPQRVRLDAPAPPGSALFLTHFAQLPREAAAAFAVRFDGGDAVRLVVDGGAAAASGALGYARVPVPAGARTVELAFDGPAGLTGVLGPVLGPADAERTRTLDGRPNLVLFVADTLRADALPGRRVWADSPDLELPTLAGLAARSTEFERAWSVTTWTLPSHASMFSGLYPTQHAATARFEKLSQRATTVAEVLRGAGYRTVAVTDGTYLSSAYQLDQGFECFDQRAEPSGRELERALAALEHHDGRPTLLVVHTYMPHSPYLPSDAARAALGVGAEVRWEDLDRRSAPLVNWAGEPGGLVREPDVAHLRDLYWAQVLDFDGRLARFLAAFEERGWSETSALVFTSDHGEAFGDHDYLFHGGPLYETQARIPLLVGGAAWPGRPGTKRGDLASHVDLAPTLVALAGVAAPKEWVGRSLLEPADDVTLWLAIDEPGRTHQLGLTDGRSKLVDDLRHGWRRAFDLVRDPDERTPLQPVPAALLESWQAGVDAVLAPRLPEETLDEPSAELLQQLRALGYLDDE